MTGSKEIPVWDEVRDHIGEYIEFEFYPGWEEPETLSGYLHGVSQSDPHDQDQFIWLHISDDPTLEEGEEPSWLGGYGMGRGRTFRIIDAPSIEKK